VLVFSSFARSALTLRAGRQDSLHSQVAASLPQVQLAGGLFAVLKLRRPSMRSES
jgi:hypothetical protein